MSQDKTGPDATPRIGLDLGRQIFDDPGGAGSPGQQGGAGEERIRQKAYEIWERDGRTGHPEDHWYRAERELSEATRAGSKPTAGGGPPAAAVEAMETVDNRPAEEGAGQKKARRRRTS